LSDDAVDDIDFDTIVSTTIGKVNQFALRCTGLSDKRESKRECHVFRVRGKVKHVLTEDDSDFHNARNEASRVSDSATTGARRDRPS
jgi:hypothetical protein